MWARIPVESPVWVLRWRDLYDGVVLNRTILESLVLDLRRARGCIS